jgi:hypothetical protein
MKEEINFSPKVVIFEDGGSLAPNIPSPYKFNGTKIFRDTTALPFLNGGPLVDKTNHGKLLNSIYASDLGPYHYALGGNMQQSSPCPPGSIWDGTKCVPEEEFRAGAAANLPAGFAPDAAIKMNQNYSDSNQWTKDYMDSPMYKQMLKNSTKGYDEEYQTIKEGRQNNLAGISPLKFAGQPEGNTSTGGETDMSTGEITAFPLGANLKTLTGHELSHAVNRNPGYGDFIPKNDEDYMIENAYTKYNQSPKYTQRASLYESNPKLEKEDAKAWEQQYRDEVGIPDETVARLRAIRQAAQQNNIYDPFNEKINTEQFQQLQNTPLEENPLWDPLKQLQGTYPNDKIYEMLNTISQNKTDNSNNSLTARNGGFIPYKRYDLFDNSLKNGGQFSGSYSLPEDSFRQGGNNLHNSVYASSAGQYPAIYATGGIMPDPGDITCPDGYTYNPETQDCEKASTTCPEGYQYNPNTGECDSLTKEWQMKLLGAPAKYNIDNTGDKYKVTDPDKYIDSEMTELTPEQLRTVQEETDGKNARVASNVWPKDFKIKQMVDPLYIAESGTHTITNPNYVNSQESEDWYNRTTFPKIPDLNYKVVIDPTKTEGYNKEENIYYVNSENTHQAKKYKEWQILKDLETKSLEDAKKYGFTVNSKDTETKTPYPENYYRTEIPDTYQNYNYNEGWDEAKYKQELLPIQQLYNNPEYLGDKANNTSYEELFKDRAKKEEEHWKEICPDCTYKHGINYSVDPNYIYRTLDPTNLVGPEDYFTKILRTEKVDHTKPDKERVKGSMEMYENPDAPFYSPSDYDRRMPTLNIHDGKTRALKPDWLRDMQIGNNHYNRQRYYNLPKLEIGSREATKLIPKIVQKITGYDKDFMEGTTDEEGNYTPGEIDNAEKENRLINFKGASSIKDLRNQKNYNEQSKNYQEELNTVRELNKNLLLEHGWDASSYKYGGGMSFANGGHSCPEGTQWDDNLKTCVKIGLNTLPQVNVSPWAVDMKAEQPTQVSNVLQNLVKKNESNNLKFPGLEPNFNYGPSDAIQSSDWMWQLPIAGKGIGQGIKALGELGSMAIPGLAGTTTGELGSAIFAGHGLTNLAMNSPKEWYDVSQGKGDWKEAALNTALHASELMGSGVPKGALNLAKETGNFLKSHPSSWLQSAEERLVNPALWKSLGHNTSGDPLGKFYNWKDTQALRKAQNKEFKLIDKLPMGWQEEGRGEAVAAIREKLGENSLRNVENRISKLANERSLERSRLPVQPVRTESGSLVGGGQGQIFLNNLNPEEVIKLGVMPGKEGTLQALVDAGNKVKAEGIPGLENVALPTRAVSFGADPIAGTEAGLQFMPWIGKPLNAKNPIAIPFEYGEGSSLAKSKLLETAKGLDKENIGIDYYGQNNIMYDPASDSYKMVDLNYTQGPGTAWNWNKLDVPVQQRLESKFGKFSQPVSEQSQRIVNSSNNFNRIVRKPEPVAKPNYGQQEFAFPTDAPVPSARLSNEEQIIQGMERSREIANEEGSLFNAPMPVDKPHAVNYPDYYSEIMQANKYNGKNKQYFTDLIESVKQQGNVASEKQFDELQRIKSGDYTRGKKSYEMGGYINRNGGELSHFYDSNIQAYNNGGNLYDNVLVFKKKI